MARVHTITRGNARLYTRTDAPDIKYPGVTSIVGMLAKPMLAPWSAKLTAELAVDSHEFIGRMAEQDRRGAVDYLKAAPRRYTAHRAGVGSMAHDAFERMMSGESVTDPDPDITEHVRHFSEFMDAVNPELISAENVAWSDTHKYAGSYDAILRVWLRETAEGYVPTPDRSGTPYLFAVDYKTSKSAYPEVALQLAAYAHADKIIDAGGNDVEMPEFDGGAVLHITEKGWQFKPVDISPRVYAYFLYLRHLYNWDREVSKTVLGSPIARGGEMTTGTQRRAG